MDLNSNVQRIAQAKTDIAAAIVAKGGTADGKIDTFASAINDLPSGGGGDDNFKALIERTISGDVVIPEGATQIGATIFSTCTGITSVSMQDSVI